MCGREEGLCIYNYVSSSNSVKSTRYKLKDY